MERRGGVTGGFWAEWYHLIYTSKEETIAIIISVQDVSQWTSVEMVTRVRSDRTGYEVNWIWTTKEKED